MPTEKKQPSVISYALAAVIVVLAAAVCTGLVILPFCAGACAGGGGFIVKPGLCECLP